MDCSRMLMWWGHNWKKKKLTVIKTAIKQKGRSPSLVALIHFVVECRWRNRVFDCGFVFIYSWSYYSMAMFFPFIDTLDIPHILSIFWEKNGLFFTLPWKMSDLGDITKLKVPELKSLLKERGLPISGTKQVLIERLGIWIAGKSEFSDWSID